MFYANNNRFWVIIADFMNIFVNFQNVFKIRVLAVTRFLICLDQAQNCESLDRLPKKPAAQQFGWFQLFFMSYNVFAAVNRSF